MPLADHAAFQGRDLRLDFFRGLALAFIFVDHVPGNPLGEVTLRAWGFADAAEMFVFLSGFAASLCYGRLMDRSGLPAARRKLLTRLGQIYLAHLGLLASFVALVFLAAAVFGAPGYITDMFVSPVTEQPALAFAASLALGFQPAFMNILPMYLVVMGLFVLALPLLRQTPLTFLALSMALWLTAKLGGVDLPAFPGGIWYFDPFAWQFLFALGAVLGYAPARVSEQLPSPRLLLPLALAVIAFAYVFSRTWADPALDAAMPVWIKDLVYPLSKTDLSAWRILHFLALAYVASRLVPADARWLKAPLAEPLIVCGQHSLAVFCLGTLLSFVGRVTFDQLSTSALAMMAINAAGFGLMFALAYGLRARKQTKRPRRLATSLQPAE